MRREADRAALPAEVGRAIAGAYIAETAGKAHAILSPHFDSPQTLVREATRVSYAFVMLRRSGHGTRGDATAELSALLREPFTTPLEADRRYLQAALALAERDWARVAEPQPRPRSPANTTMLTSFTAWRSWA